MVDPDVAIMVTILAPDFRFSGADQEQSELSSLAQVGYMTFDSFDLRQDKLALPPGTHPTRAIPARPNKPGATRRASYEGNGREGIASLSATVLGLRPSRSSRDLKDLSQKR